MTISRTLYSSDSNEWSTPDDLFAVLDAEFNFTLDCCATAKNAKCDRYFTIEDDGLAQDWGGWGETVFMNPPYGPGIRKWMTKAYEECCKGATVVCLVPARTDTQWWHEHVLPHAEVFSIKGRLRFNGHHNSAPFPSAVVVYRPSWSKTFVYRGAVDK